MPKQRSSDPDSRATNQKRWLKGCCVVVAVLPLLICGIGYFALRSYIGRVGDRLPNEVTKLKSMGIPTEPADLVRKPPVPEAQNAAMTYQAISYQFNALKSDSATKDIASALGRYGGTKPLSGDFPLAQQGVQKFASIFSDAEKLLDKPDLDFKRDYAKGPKLLFPEFAQQRQLSKWMASRARLQWESGDLDGALRSIHVEFRIGEHAAQEPNLIGALVSVACHAVAWHSLDEYLKVIKDDPNRLAAVKTMLGEIKGFAFLKRAFAGELVLGRAAIQTIEHISDISDPGAVSEASSHLDVLANPAFRRMFDANYCNAWRRIFEKMPVDGADWKGAMEATSVVAKQVEADKSLDNLLNRILFPVFDQACVAVGKQLAEWKLAILATQLLLDRKNGLPSDLSKYGERSIDPLSGKAFGYQRTGKGFRIWSVGRDLKDNGGVIREPGSKVQSGGAAQGIDIVMGFDTIIPTVP